MKRVSHLNPNADGSKFSEVLEDVSVPLTADLIAECLGKCRHTIYNWAKRGIIPANMIGGSWCFDRYVILNWWQNLPANSHAAQTQTPLPRVRMPRVQG